MEVLSDRVQLPDTIDFTRFDGSPAQLRAINTDSISVEDIVEIMRICNQPSVKEFVTYQYVTGSDGEYTDEDAHTFIKFATEGREKGESTSYLIHDENDQIIGNIGLKFLNEKEPEVGYWSDTENENARGFMTNAVLALCVELDSLGYKTVRAYTVPENSSSQSVLGRAGFEEGGREEKELGGILREVIVFQKKLSKS